MIQALSPASALYHIGPLELDPARLLLRCGSQTLPLGPKVVETLLALAEQPGELLSKERLLTRIWPEGFVEESNLTQNIYVLRKTLYPFWKAQPIETVPRRGYRLTAPVRLAMQGGGERAVPRPKKFARFRRAAAIFACVAVLTAFGGAGARAPQNTRAQALSMRARQLYALGRYYWNLRSASGLRKSVAFFERVTRLNPRSALGYAGLADAYLMIVDYGGDGRGSPLARKAKADAARAIALDPFSAEAQTSYGMVRELLAHDVPGAERHLRRAISLDPNYALAHEWYGSLLLMSGRTKPARTQLETAALLDPTAIATNSWLAADAYFDHRYAASIAYGRQALDLDPSHLDSLLMLALSQERLRDYPGALASLRRFAAHCGCASGSQVYFSGVYAHMGRRAAAVAALQSGLKDRGVPAGEIAIAYVELGERTHALEFMHRARFTDPMQRMFLALDPRMDPVRRDPRFRSWMRTG